VTWTATSIDISLVVAAERRATGANAHCLHNLAHRYVLACEAGNNKLAEESETNLRRALRETFEVQRQD
jgi:hypothetical protein